MPSSFREEDFQRFCFFFLLVAMATRVMDGIQSLELLCPRKIPAKFHQEWPSGLGGEDVLRDCGRRTTHDGRRTTDDGRPILGDHKSSP